MCRSFTVIAGPHRGRGNPYSHSLAQNISLKKTNNFEKVLDIFMFSVYNIKAVWQMLL